MTDKGGETAKLSLPPEMASLLASMANQVKGQQAAEQQKQQHNAPSQGGYGISNGSPSIPPDMQAVVQKVLVRKSCILYDITDMPGVLHLFLQFDR